MEKVEEMSINRLMAETDIMQFLNSCFSNAHAYGYGTDAETPGKKALGSLYQGLENLNVTEEQLLEVDDLISEVARACEVEGFKKGFHIALQIVVSGLGHKN